MFHTLATAERRKALKDKGWVLTAPENVVTDIAQTFHT